MKTAIMTCTAAAVLLTSTSNLSAGDREWATAGKILTGLVAGAVLVKALEPDYSYTSVAYTTAPAIPAPIVYAPPPPVYVAPPQPVYVAPPPPPVYVHPAPVAVYPPPVYVAPPPVFVRPVPVVSFHFGFGRTYYAPPVYRVCR